MEVANIENLNNLIEYNDNSVVIVNAGFKHVSMQSIFTSYKESAVIHPDIIFLF